MLVQWNPTLDDVGKVSQVHLSTACGDEVPLRSYRVLVLGAGSLLSTGEDGKALAGSPHGLLRWELSVG